MMKKIAMLLSLLSLTGALYAGDACCGAKKDADKPAKKMCGDCTKEDKTCDACKEKAAKEVKTDDSAEKKD